MSEETVGNVILEPMEITLIKPIMIKFNNRAYRYLVKTFGSSRKAIEALRSITPRREEPKEGEVVPEEGMPLVKIEQDEAFYNFLTEWIKAGAFGADKLVDFKRIDDEVDDMEMFAFVELRTTIWEAFGKSVPISKIKSSDDPTKATTKE